MRATRLRGLGRKRRLALFRDKIFKKFFKLSAGFSVVKRLYGKAICLWDL